MTDLVVRDKNTFALVAKLEQEGVVTPTGLDFEALPDLNYNQLEAMAAFFGHSMQMSRWALFDTLLAIETQHGELVAQAAEVTQLQPQSIENGLSLARRVPRSRRRENVPFSTHAEVASLKPNDQRRWLKVAEEEKLTKAELRARVQAEKNGHPDIIDRDPPVCPSCHRPM